MKYSYGTFPLICSILVACIAAGYITWYYAQTVSQIYESVNLTDVIN